MQGVSQKQTNNKSTVNQGSNFVGSSKICGHTFDTYLSNFIFTSKETRDRNRNIGQEVFYFEIKILNSGTRNLVMIGISEKEFQLNKQLGVDKKAWAYKSDGKIFHGKANGEEYGPKFERLDVIGCGLIMSRKQIFFTHNGRYLGTAFSDIEIQKDNLYASVCLQSINEEIQSNFSGSKYEQFIFDLDGFKNDLAQSEFLEITKIKIQRHQMREMVKSYLIHNAYIETLQALEEDSGFFENIDKNSIKADDGVQQKSIEEQKIEIIEQSETIKIEQSIPQVHPQLETQKSEKIERRMTEDDRTMDNLGLNKQISIASDVSADDYVSQLINRNTRSESMNVGYSELAGGNISFGSNFANYGGLKKRPARSGSLYVEPKISDFVIEKSEQLHKGDSAIYLKNRGILRHMIQSGEIEEARNLIQSQFKALYDTNINIRAYLDVLEFINFIKEEDLQGAIDFSSLHLQNYVNKGIKIPTKLSNGRYAHIDLVEITALLCYKNPETSDLKFLVSENQRQLIADKLNTEILGTISQFKSFSVCKQEQKKQGATLQHSKNVQAINFLNVGEQFVSHYYNVFDTQRDGLKELYTDDSMLTFEGEQFKGVASILGKFSSFGNIKHAIKSFDAQPSVNGGILCFVSGDLFIEGNENPVKFAQVFHLLPGGSAGFFCFNDMFRLNYG